VITKHSLSSSEHCHLAQRLLFTLAAAAGLVACGQDPPAVGTTGDAVSLTAPANADPRAITLITGDRVTLSGNPGAASVHVEPGPGRAGVGYATVHRGDDVFVIPHDVASLVAAGRVDRALFNVTRLLADGYGDHERGDLPLILTGVPSAPAGFAASGLVAGRAIAALHAIALRQPKTSPGAALASLRSASSLAGPPPTLWLDRRYKLVLDHSVPQIGAPAAWARGFTGAGVTVAVIDGGIDASHPDLAGKVVEARSFIDDGLGLGDIDGHATHVASIIAGTGAASGGLYRGVAPDAQLLSARVCGLFDIFTFCDGSAILAAMAWAVVEKHAPIVNLSIGGFDDPETDPLEDAVNRLSAQYGTLFVIAAGNDGEFGDQTIESPGSAEAALTVGAVGRDDQLAVFSSRGPTAAGGVIKPDLTAPGVDIVAARASGVAAIGIPVGDAYQRLSGTSMATPHVAGAAAILLQQHPAWTGAQLKAALIGAARPDPTLTAYQQGAGRVDVDRATRQRVTVAPVSFDFGLAAWPHTDDPVLTRTLTYRNDGDAPITLALAASLSLADHRAAPASMIRVSPASLTIAAGASGEAKVTVDTNGDAPDDRYSGSVIATAGDTRLVTAVAIAREVESYDLTLRQIDRAGQDATSFIVLASRNPTGRFNLLDIDGKLTIRLPRDSYSLHALPEDPVFLVYPDLVLDHDSVVTFDSRLARPVEVDVPGVALTFGEMSAMSWDVPALFAVSDTWSELLTAHFGPELAGDEYHAWVQVTAVPTGSGIIEPPAGDPFFAGFPDRYGLAHQERGRFITGWQARIPRGQLATIDSVSIGKSPSVYRKYVDSMVLDAPPGPSLSLSIEDYAPGVHRTEHLFGAGIQWLGDSRRAEPWPGHPGIFFAVEDHTAARIYQPGNHYVERYNLGPYGPALADLAGTPAANRQGDVLTIAPSMFADRVFAARFSWSAPFHQRSTLFRDGAMLVDHGDDFHEFFFPPVTVPPDAASYRFEADYERGPNLLDGSPLFDLSTHVTASWTFRSQHEPGTAARILPLPTLRFVPELDDDNRASGSTIALPAIIARPLGSPTPRITRVNVDVSFDDGVSWTPVSGILLGEHWLGTVQHPPGAAFASLRGTVEDVDGRRSDLTIIHAYRVGP
jgi:subtilisin family serine protease